ncbi:hypothetical protein KQH61_04090 [bacterium]|nr:hypothetical protein [bacterium]MCB2179083.1 hypothetical protein [bacterium]
MKLQKLIVGLVVIALSVAFVGNVVASGTFSDYNLTVPKLSGSVTTNNKTKVNADDRAQLCSELVGGDYYIKVRIEKLDNTPVSSYASVADWMIRFYTLSPSVANISYHARLTTTLTTIVNVQAIGRWSPDSPTPGYCQW